jgi:polyphosphate kinase
MSSKASPEKDLPHPVDLDDPKLYINRELSAIRFNARVMEEAEDTTNPLLERVNFLAIVSGNLDEFFMVRVSGLLRQLNGGSPKLPPGEMTPAEQLSAIRSEVLPLLKRSETCWTKTLVPSLKEAGISIRNLSEVRGEELQALRDQFQRDIFPALTPLAIDLSRPFPHISNLSLNLAVTLEGPSNGPRLARVKVPDVFPRLIPLDGKNLSEKVPKRDESPLDLVWLEDVVSANLDLLFPQMRIVGSYPFRVTRDSELGMAQDEEPDHMLAIEEGVGQRRFGSPVRLEICSKMPDDVSHVLKSNLGVRPEEVYSVRCPIGLSKLMELQKLDRPDLKEAPFTPSVPEALAKERSLFAVLQKGDLLLYHPYESFSHVIDFIKEAARDPAVVAIKMTLYRIGARSPIIDALIEASESGKQVAVLVELKARFDEETNVEWARSLEEAGVHIAYGVPGLKTHAKLCLVVRREWNGIKRYVHVGTGNYNHTTARIYADLDYFTSVPAVGEEVSELFNLLTGYSKKTDFHHLLVSPFTIRDGILSRIEREVRCHQKGGDGHIAMKMNALVDNRCIRALYLASQAGVRVDLQVRGISCLRAGVPGVSENITQTSLVGRFLEHSRIYYFHNGGKEEILIGSSDLMPRNLDKRIEALIPIQDPRCQRALRDLILNTHLGDNVKARIMGPDGSYQKRSPAQGKGLDAQRWFIENRGIWNRPS